MNASSSRRGWAPVQKPGRWACAASEPSSSTGSTLIALISSVSATIA